MKNLKLALLLLLMVFSSACGGDDDGSTKEKVVTIEDFVGSWKATSMKFTNNSNVAEQFDFISNGGALDFTMLTGGKVRTWMSLGEFSDEWDGTAVMKNSNTIVVTPVEAERGTNTFKFELTNSSLTLTNEDDSFDFTLSGEAEVSATSVIVLVRK